MPGYGVREPSAGTGLLSWQWAVERLVASPNYWVATVWPNGQPHVMPVGRLGRGRVLVQQQRSIEKSA